VALGLVVLNNGISANFFTLAAQFRLSELVFGQPATFSPAITTVIEATSQQRARLPEQLGPIDPVAVAPYLGRSTRDILGEIEVALDDGTLIRDAGGLRAELWPLLDTQPGGPPHGTSDLPLSRKATGSFAEEDNAPAMRFTDPTTGEAYTFTSIGRVGSAATP
jgi:hypothetical protein